VYSENAPLPVLNFDLDAVDGGRRLDFESDSCAREAEIIGKKSQYNYQISSQNWTDVFMKICIFPKASICPTNKRWSRRTKQEPHNGRVAVMDDQIWSDVRDYTVYHG
jgi:hypothetical protein